VRVILVPCAVLLGVFPLQAAFSQAPGHPPKGSIDSLSYQPPTDSLVTEDAPIQNSTDARRPRATRPGQQKSGPGPQIVPVIEPAPVLRGSSDPTLN